MHKTANKKYGRFSNKVADEITWTEICVYLIGLFKICIKGRDPLILKAVTMIDPVTGWFEITQYNDKKVMTIANLVETTWIV